jgi:hypothetical protein
MRAKYLIIGLTAVVLGVTFAEHASAQNINVPYYQPQFYVDRLVFYDNVGTPIYYEGNTAYTVPRSYAFYNDLVRHYQGNAGNYANWYGELGYAHLHFRRPVTTSYYQPLYYQEYPVYYDPAGMPIYYVNGRQIYVPRSYVRFHALTGHYRARRGAYKRWYAGPGRHFRWYRRPIATGYYRPQYHDGHVLFFNAGGRPYYHHGGRTVYVPARDHRYGAYVTHYRRHRPHYNRWYSSRGRHNHAYRRSVNHRRRVVNRRAPRAVRGRAVVRTHRRHRGGPPRHPGVVHHPGQPRRAARPGRVVHHPRPGHPKRHVRPGRVGHRPGPRAHHRRPAPRVDRRVDCRRQPGHPSCRGRGPRHQPRAQPQRRRGAQPHAQPQHRRGRRGRQPAAPPRGERRRRHR